ncbi:hypothetical protein MIR68_011965 [Amoeboaphelidium protococcarum]|nr:hypothetical protein MIR68_011965 [Amoeboaphelidium protococcarum]
MSDSESDNAVYCICQQEDDGSFMINCDKCSQWFHGRCVSITTDTVQITDSWNCPDCRAANNPSGIIRAVNSPLQLGKKRKSVDKLQAVKGKKRRQKTPASEKEQTALIQQQEQQQQKSEWELNPVRVKVVESFRKLLADSQALDDAASQLGRLQSLAESLESEMFNVHGVKDAQHSSDQCGDAYKEKFRLLLVNLRKSNNSRIIKRLLEDEISPVDVVGMTAEDFTDEKLQQEKELILQESLRNKILTSQQASTIFKKTHKGDEVVKMSDDYDKTSPHSSSTTTVNHNDQYGSTQSSTRPSSANSINSSTDFMRLQTGGVESPQESYTPSAPSSLSTSREASTASLSDQADMVVGSYGADGQSGSIQSPTPGSEDLTDTFGFKVDSHNPTHDASMSNDPLQQSQSLEKNVKKSSPSQSGVSILDALLATVDTTVTSPVKYTPQYHQFGFDAEEEEEEERRSMESIEQQEIKFPPKDRLKWQGNVKMDGVGDFDVQLYGLPEMESVFQNLWTELGEKLRIHGRIQPSAVEKYIFQQIDVPSREIIVAELYPSSRHSGFDDIYNYFKEKDRYAVVPKVQPAVKDCYLIPCGQHQDSYSIDVLQQLDIQLSADRNCDILIMVLVVGKDLMAKSTKKQLSQEDLVQSVQEEKQTVTVGLTRENLQLSQPEEVPDINAALSILGQAFSNVGQFNYPQQQPAAAVQPAPESEYAGIHPSRLAQLAQPQRDSNGSSQSSYRGGHYGNYQ